MSLRTCHLLPYTNINTNIIQYTRIYKYLEQSRDIEYYLFW